MTDERIKALIILYDDCVRYNKKLLDCKLAEELLSVIPTCTINQNMLEVQLGEKTNECKGLKICLETAMNNVAKLYAKHREDARMKEFLDFAIFLSTFRDSNENTGVTSDSKSCDFLHKFEISLENHCSAEFINDDNHESKKSKLQFDEMLGDYEYLKQRLKNANEDIIKLNYELKLAHDSLKAETVRREQIECERDSSKYLAEKYRSLLSKYQQSIRQFDEISETNSEVMDENSKNPTIQSDSNSVRKVEFSSLKNKLDEINFSLKSDHHESPMSSPHSSFQDVNSSTMIIHSNENDKYVLENSDKTSSQSLRLSAWREIHDHESVQNSNSIINKSASSAIKLAQSHLQNNDGFGIEISQHLCPIQKFYDVDSPKNDSKSAIERIQIVDVKSTIAKNSAPHISLQSSITNEESTSLHDSSPNHQVVQVPTRIRKITKLKKKHEFVDLGNDDIPNQRKYQVSDFHCNICHRYYLRESSLNAHKCQTFKCFVCNRCFTNQSNKIRHERTVHGGEAPFQCAHCNKRCTRKSNLILHIYTHHFPILQKQFKCTVCGKAFIKQSDLNKHKLMHSSERPMKCSICDKRFKYSADRRRHEKRVHKKQKRHEFLKLRAL